MDVQKKVARHPGGWGCFMLFRLWHHDLAVYKQALAVAQSRTEK
jgi:hypothetical protein